MEFFSGVPKLEVLLLGSSKIKNVSLFFESNLTKIFENNINLQFLDLSDLGLSTIHNNVLKYQKLKTLILSKNKLSSIDNGTFNLTSLDHLDLSYNYFRAIPINLIIEMEQSIKTKTSNKTFLNLNYNPFFCDFHSITNINIMLHSRVIIQDLNVSNGKLQCIMQCIKLLFS